MSSSTQIAQAKGFRNAFSLLESGSSVSVSSYKIHRVLLENDVDSFQLDSSSAISQFVQSLQPLQRKNAQLIRNIHTEMGLLQLGNLQMPVTSNETEYANSYVCSSYNAYISYAAEELHLIKNHWSQATIRSLLPFMSSLLKWGKINRTLSINNWLFSTCPFPRIHFAELKAMTERLSLENPHHSLSIRSLNRYSNAQEMDNLEKLGWIFLPARQVYLFKQEANWWKKNNVKNDQRLLRKTELTLVEPHEHLESDFAEIERCFNQLYIEKHSQYNPQYSAEYFYGLHQQGTLEFYSYRDSDNRIVATMALFEQNDVITMPVVGYDTNLPQSMGLYRLTIGLLLKITHQRNKLLNLSSGAAEFKKNRGGEAEIEYTAYYCKHLPIEQKLLLKSLNTLLNRFAPSLFAANQI